MPPARPNRHRARPCRSARSALLAVVLAGLTASLFTSSGPQAASGPDGIAPSVPTNLHLVGAAATSVTVAWSAPTDGVGVAGYRVSVGNGRYSRTTETTYTETGLAWGTSYSVEVRTYDGVRNLSQPARSVAATAPCLDTLPPSQPSGLQQIARSSTTATLAWTASTDNVAVVGYGISRGGLEIDTTAETSYAFIGLACGSTHSVAVRAYDVSLNGSGWVSHYVSTSPCGDVTAPTAPSGLVLSDRTPTTISFGWSASTDNVGVAQYVVFRNGTQMGATAALTYALSGLTCGTAHTVGVEAVDGAGNRSARTTAVMSTASCSTPPPPGDSQPPSNPSGLTITSATQSSIGLGWSASSDNVGVAGYDAYRNGVRVHSGPGTSYAFTGLSCVTGHQLGLAAYDAAGNRSGIVSVTAATSPCSDSSPPTTPANLVLLSRTSTSVTVSWAASSDNVGVAGYGAYRDGTLVGSTGETTYTFTGLACGTSRTFGIDAYDAAGNRSTRANVVLQTAACGDTQAPSTPTQLAVSRVTQTGATLSWAASSDNVGVAGYDVFVNGTKVATVTGTSSGVGSLTCNTGYTLGVEAFDAAGNRSSRATVSATTAACSAPPPPPPPPPSGGANRYVSPSGSDSATCTQSAPCASFNRAWQVAQPGDVVEVAGGSYAGQTLEPATKSGTALIVFRPAAGAQVTVNGDLVSGSRTADAGAKHFEVRDMKITGGVSLRWGAEDITIRSIDASTFDLNSSKNIRIIGGDWGPAIDGWNSIATTATGPITQDILIDGAVIHDYLLSAYGAGPADIHMQCLQIWPGLRVTVRNSTFRNCTDFGVLVDPYKPGTGDITFENNFFDIPMPGDQETVACNPNCPRGGSSLRFDDRAGWSGAIVRYNTFVGELVVDPGVSNAVVKGNVGVKADNFFCGGSNIAYSYNVWSNATCSGTDRKAALSTLLVDPNGSDGSIDFHLRSGAIAIGAGDPGSYPSGDRDGESRPQGTVDAGADERS